MSLFSRKQPTPEPITPELPTREAWDESVAQLRGHECGFAAGEAGEALPDAGSCVWVKGDGSRRPFTDIEQRVYRNALISGYLEAKDELAANKRALKW